MTRHRAWHRVLAPLTPATHALIGADELALLPSGARLVNIGRGPTVVEEALVASLRSGHLRGAALDVFEAEPLPTAMSASDASRAVTVVPMLAPRITPID